MGTKQYEIGRSPSGIVAAASYKVLGWDLMCLQRLVYCTCKILVNCFCGTLTFIEKCASVAIESSLKKVPRVLFQWVKY